VRVRGESESESEGYSTSKVILGQNEAERNDFGTK